MLFAPNLESIADYPSPVAIEAYGTGFNGPPPPFACPGREVCSGKCGKLCVHAEMRALRVVERHGRRDLQLLHVELGADGSVVACAGPGCWQCSREILDVGFVSGVWLYELGVPPDEMTDAAKRGIATLMRPHWRRYNAIEFHRITLKNTGVDP